MIENKHYFLSKDGKIFLKRCPKCERENYALAVATGQCAWCGFDANEKKEESKNETI